MSSGYNSAYYEKKVIPKKVYLEMQRSASAYAKRHGFEPPPPPGREYYQPKKQRKRKVTMSPLGLTFRAAAYPFMAYERITKAFRNRK